MQHPGKCTIAPVRQGGYVLLRIEDATTRTLVMDVEISFEALGKALTGSGDQACRYQVWHHGTQEG